jgi:hypothetical protein
MSTPLYQFKTTGTISRSPTGRRAKEQGLPVEKHDFIEDKRQWLRSSAYTCHGEYVSQELARCPMNCVATSLSIVEDQNRNEAMLELDAAHMCGSVLNSTTNMGASRRFQ